LASLALVALRTMKVLRKVTLALNTTERAVRAGKAPGVEERSTTAEPRDMGATRAAAPEPPPRRMIAEQPMTFRPSTVTRVSSAQRQWSITVTAVTKGNKISIFVLGPKAFA
jgi:hypothetical protein